MESIFIIIILILSIVVHEVAHGSVAYALGDPTAKYAGRLTLNPIKHLDMVGSFLLPFFLLIMNSPFLLGWAKPVPINPYNFIDQKYGQLKVALAGPMSNFSLAIIFGIAGRLLPLEDGVRSDIGGAFPAMIEAGFWGQVFYLFLFIVFINTLLGIFNLIPVPPLDGSHILFTFFPSLEYKVKMFYARLGFLGMALLIFAFIWFFPVIFYFVYAVFRIIAGV